MTKRNDAPDTFAGLFNYRASALGNSNVGLTGDYAGRSLDNALAYLSGSPTVAVPFTVPCIALCTPPGVYAGDDTSSRQAGLIDAVNL